MWQRLTRRSVSVVQHRVNSSTNCTHTDVTSAYTRLGACEKRRSVFLSPAPSSSQRLHVPVQPYSSRSEHPKRSKKNDDMDCSNGNIDTIDSGRALYRSDTRSADRLINNEQTVRPVKSGERAASEQSTSEQRAASEQDGSWEDDSDDDDLWNDESDESLFSPEQVAAETRLIEAWLPTLSASEREIYDKALLLHQLLLADGQRAPQFMSLAWWKRVMYQRAGTDISYYTDERLKGEFRFLFSIEQKKIRRRIVARQNVKDLEEFTEEKKRSGTKVLWDSVLFVKHRKSTSVRFHRHHLAQSLLYGQPLVVDCRFDTGMTRSDLSSLSTQLQYLFNSNKLLKNPFHVHFTSYNPDSVMFNKFSTKQGEPFNPDDFMMTFAKKPVEDMFPRRQLVYLSPDAPEFMKSFSKDDVYIIGGLVDSRSHHPHASLAVAKRLGIRTAKFPLELYPGFKSGKKSLNVNTSFDILARLRESGHWDEALDYLPMRKRRSVAEHTFRKFQREGRRGDRREQPRAFESTLWKN